MSTTNDVLAAMNSLAESIRGVSISNSIKKAQSKVDEIQADNTKSEFERIKAQQAIAQNVASSVLAYGGNASQAQTAMASLAPNIPDAAMARLEATGANTIGEAQQKLAEEAEKKALDAEDRAFKRQTELEKLRQAGAEKLAAMKTESKTQKKALPPAVSTKLAELSDMKAQLIDLKNDFGKKGSQIGPVAQFRPNILTPSEDVAYTSQVKDFFNQYRRVITGAAASIPELKSLLPAVPNESDFGGDFQAKIETQIKGVDRGLQNRVSLLKSQGFDTDALEESLGIISQNTAPNVPVASAPAMQPSGIPGLTKRKK